MEKEMASSLFVNDGSFLERFKQLQQEKQKKASTAQEEPQSGINSSETSKEMPGFNNVSSSPKENVTRKVNSVSSSGKLAFSLKQKSKLAAAPVKLGADEDEDEGSAGDDGPVKRPKLAQHDSSTLPVEHVDVAYVLKSL